MNRTKTVRILDGTLAEWQYRQSGGSGLSGVFKSVRQEEAVCEQLNGARQQGSLAIVGEFDSMAEQRQKSC